MQRLHVLDLKGIEVEVVQPQQGQRVVDLEAQRIGLDEICALLDRSGVDGVAG